MLFVIALICLSMGVADATVGVSCLADSGCGIGECCQASYGIGGHGGPQMVGKRQVTGLCQMMGTDTVNKQCEPSTSVFNGIHRQCHCASGYDCVNTGLYEVPFGPIRNCQKHT